MISGDNTKRSIRMAQEWDGQNMEPIRSTEPRLRGIQHELAKREPLFHNPSHGTSREALESMVEGEFWEIGTSGQRYSREYVIDTLVALASAPHNKRWDSEDFYCQQIALDTYLLTFTLHQEWRSSHRATIWRRTDNGWKIVFHQGTVAPTVDTKSYRRGSIAR
jgi:hypothetical protein